MTADETVLALAARVDYFTSAQLETWFGRRWAQMICARLVASGTLIRVRDWKLASTARLIRKCDLAKLEAECAVTRRTLAGVK